MTLADQKSSFIGANGNPMTIIRSTGNLPTVGRVMALKRKTDFFSINYLREALFQATSPVQRGDLIQDQTTGEQYFVVGYQIKSRSGIISSINTQLYMVNYPSVSIQRYQAPSMDGNGNRSGSGSFPVIATVPANIQHVSGRTEYKDGLLLPSTVFKATMQTGISLILEDRFILDGKSYKVDDINLSVIPGLQVIQLSVDTR